MRLLNPIVLQLRQDQVVLAYPFKYLSAVNGKVSEIVVNYENKRNYSGCDDTSSINPTCGIKYDKGIKVSYSEGFCCACPTNPVDVRHPRGGQDCSLKVDPQDIEKQRYKASAHCLQFSDIWFSVSALDDPIMNHNVYLQVFNERQLINGSSIWVSLTNREVFQLSPKEPSVFGANRTIVATFMTTSAKNGTPLISAENNRLLIPQPIPGIGLDKLPPVMKNGAKDYILLSKSIIDASGITCDKAGISYEGFYKQKKRCKVAKNTCLKNQPLDFWEGDEEKRKAGKKGSYLLQFYGQPHKTPILIEQDTKEHFLVLEYYAKQLSVLTVEFKADDITTLFIGKDVHIMKVLTASSGKQIMVNVTVANDGLVEATYSAKAKNCQYEVPDSKSVTRAIPPQQKEELVLVSVPGVMELHEKFFCTVIVSSKMYGVVAKRKVTVKPHYRCVCVGHCECACFGESLVCQPMTVESYQEAGYKGDLPLLTARPPKLPWIVEHPFFALFALFLILFILGFIKAVFGVMGFKKIGDFGFNNRLYKPGSLKKYPEPKLRKRNVIYDKDGYPIHPDLKTRTRAIPNEILCVLNILFFFIWPIMKLYDFCAGKFKKESVTPTVSYSAVESEDEDDKNKPSIAGNVPTVTKMADQKNKHKQEASSKVRPKLERISLIPETKNSDTKRNPSYENVRQWGNNTGTSNENVNEGNIKPENIPIRTKVLDEKNKQKETQQAEITVKPETIYGIKTSPSYENVEQGDNNAKTSNMDKENEKNVQLPNSLITKQNKPIPQKAPPKPPRDHHLSVSNMPLAAEKISVGESSSNESESLATQETWQRAERKAIAFT